MSVSTRVVSKLNSLSSSRVTGNSSGSSTVRFDPAANRNTERAEWENWASTNRCTPEYFHTPRTVEEIQAILTFARSRGDRVRVVGYGHSPGHIALTEGHMIALGVHFSRVIAIKREAMQVTVEAGISLESLNAALDEVDLALPSLGSISDQTLGGALACGTHGTSARAGSILAGCVIGLDLIDAAGKVWSCSKDTNPELFQAARISLGALGIITSVTLQCERAYDLIETTVTIPFGDWVTPSKFDSMLHHPDADFVRFHWIPHTETVVYTRMKKVYDAKQRRDTVVKQAAAQASTLQKTLQKVRATKDRFVGFHMLQALYYASTFGNLDRVLVPRIASLYSRLVYPSMSPASSSSSASSPSSASTSIWTRQDRHDRILNFDCLFKQYVTEWAIDQRYTIEALVAVRKYIAEQKFVVHFPIEVRFGGGDESEAQGGDGIWLSPCYQRKQTWIGIIMYRPYGKDVEWSRYFEGFERLMNGFVPNPPTATASGPIRPTFDGKPHWAKNVVMPLSEIPFTRLYPKLSDFFALRRELDPSGMFQNAYLTELEDATTHTAKTQIRAKL